VFEWKLLFWAAAALIAYTYFGYPLVLSLRRSDKSSRLQKKSSTAGNIFFSFDVPTVTLIIPAHNEERWIGRKIENTLALAYPGEKLEIIVASDGSSDRTPEIVRGYRSRGVSLIAFPTRMGKQEILNRLATRSRGEIVVLTDANALLAPDALTALVAPFVDSAIACAIGRRVCTVQRASVAGPAESLYWRYESWIKRAEFRWHSCLAATGQLYAVRRNLFPHVERVGEDFFIPMKILASTGRRVAYVPEAVATIPAAATLAGEYERKTRAHVSFLLSLPLLKELVVPGRSPVWWQFLSHHFLRMLVPPAMLAAFLASLALAPAGRLYLFALLAQVAFFGLAAIGWRCALAGLRPKLFYFPFYFVFVQCALAEAWCRWPRRDYAYAWQPTERLPDAG
jgi:cellulose synthase/poly-beta-1,6-N-acetylglucosamine synthase-like glycosyltransferase